LNSYLQDKLCRATRGVSDTTKSEIILPQNKITRCICPDLKFLGVCNYWGRERICWKCAETITYTDILSSLSKFDFLLLRT